MSREKMHKISAGRHPEIRHFAQWVIMYKL
nr:MAG TPA: hypothetical protein [Caudoviricetes sp.]